MDHVDIWGHKFIGCSYKGWGLYAECHDS